MGLPLWYLWLIVFICLAIILVVYVARIVGKGRFLLLDTFADFPTTITTEEAVVYIYRSTLDREPTPVELLQATEDIQKNRMTYQALRMRLIQSEEYARMMRVQSNRLVPQLERSLQDRLLLQHIADVYQEERKVPLPPDMVFPLRDIFVSFNFNNCTLRALLRDLKYPAFETETRMSSTLTREKIASSLASRFNLAELEAIGRGISGCGVYGGGVSGIGNDVRSGSIIDGVIYGADGKPMAVPPAAAAAIAAAPAAASAAPTSAAAAPAATAASTEAATTPATAPVAATSAATAPATAPATAAATTPATTAATSSTAAAATTPASGTAPAAASATSNPGPGSGAGLPPLVIPSASSRPNPGPVVPFYRGAAPTDRVYRTIYDSDSDMTDMMRRIQLEADRQFDRDQAAQALQTHRGGMVLRPEFAWTVPQRRPPICLPYGPQVPAQPTVPSSKLLLGTPLPQATYNTRVGSMVQPPRQ